MYTECIIDLSSLVYVSTLILLCKLKAVKAGSFCETPHLITIGKRVLHFGVLTTFSMIPAFDSGISRFLSSVVHSGYFEKRRIRT